MRVYTFEELRDIAVDRVGVVETFQHDPLKFRDFNGRLVGDGHFKTKIVKAHGRCDRGTIVLQGATAIGRRLIAKGRIKYFMELGASLTQAQAVVRSGIPHLYDPQINDFLVEMFSNPLLTLGIAASEIVSSTEVETFIKTDGRLCHYDFHEQLRGFSPQRRNSIKMISSIII